MQNDNKKELLGALGLVASIGVSLTINIMVGLFGGRLLDNWLGSSPWGLLGGILLGTLTGFWSIYKRITGNK